VELSAYTLNWVVADKELGELAVKCDRGVDKLTEGQTKQCMFYYFALFNTWAYIYYQNIDESLTEAIWDVGNTHYQSELKNTLGFRVF
tara:strand:+ start:1843 stop:2106 length:264 start_codon:yes stop_codon:yes gene_type:complete